MFDKFVVEKQAEYQPAWISYLSMAAGILQSLGTKVDIIDVGGYTGYAFHLNTCRTSTCPSAPTVADFETFAKGLESMGWKVEQVWEGESYNFPMTEEQSTKAQAHFKELKHIITTTQRPIGIWGAPVPEFAIMNGFEDENYLVSTFRSLQGIEETPIKYNHLITPGGMFKLEFKSSFEIKDQSTTDKETVERALKIVRGLKEIAPETHKRYASGVEMFDELARILETGVVPKSEEEVAEVERMTTPVLHYHGNSYTAMCNQEGLAIASEFLNRLAKRYKEKKVQDDLITASTEYGKASVFLKKYTEIFPFSFEKDFVESEFSDEKKSKGAQLLRKAKSNVEFAIESLQRAMKKW
jgi:hypothetical protein